MMPIDIPGSARYTDADDDIAVEYPGVLFDHRYHGVTAGVIDTTRTSNPFTTYTANKQVTTFAAEVHFPSYAFPLGAGATANNGGAWYYEYTFPPGGQWAQDHVRAANQAVAFCDLYSSWCNG